VGIVLLIIPTDCTKKYFNEKVFSTSSFLHCSSVSCSNNQNSEGYSILGTVPADIVGKIYLQRFEDKQYTTVDSAEIVNGTFTFAGSVTEPMVYAIVPSQKSQRAQVFLDNHPLHITLDEEWEVKRLKGIGKFRAFSSTSPTKQARHT